MKRIIQFYCSPLIFGVAFLGPLAGQILTEVGIQLPIPALVAGLVVGGALGLMAQLRGSWIWVK